MSFWDAQYRVDVCRQACHIVIERRFDPAAVRSGLGNTADDIAAMARRIADACTVDGPDLAVHVREVRDFKVGPDGAVAELHSRVADLLLRCDELVTG